MNVWQSIILGIVQGLTEFLPVSSSGHLVLLQRIFHIQEGNQFFTLMLHVGTLIAVILVFWKDIWVLLKDPFGKLSRYVILSTMVTGVMYLLLGKIIDDSYSGVYLGWGFLYTAVILFLVDRVGSGRRGRSMNAKDASFIGLMQGVAMFPGISRSGSTIAGGLFTGLDKDFVARYSFILSIPAIVGGAVMELKDVGSSTLGVSWLAVLVGIICAAVAGVFAISFMLKVIQKKKLSYFSLYLMLLGLFILLDQSLFHLVFK